MTANFVTYISQCKSNSPEDFIYLFWYIFNHESHWWGLDKWCRRFIFLFFCSVLVLRIENDILHVFIMTQKWGKTWISFPSPVLSEPTCQIYICMICCLIMKLYKQTWCFARTVGTRFKDNWTNTVCHSECLKADYSDAFSLIRLTSWSGFILSLVICLQLHQYQTLPSGVEEHFIKNV